MAKEKIKVKEVKVDKKPAEYEWKNDRTLSYTMRQRKIREEQDGSN
jgi:hypothetical protein